MDMSALPDIYSLAQGLRNYYIDIETQEFMIYCLFMFLHGSTDRRPMWQDHQFKRLRISRSESNPMDKGAYNTNIMGKIQTWHLLLLCILVTLRVTRMYRMNHHFILLCHKSEANFEGKATKS